MIGFREKWESMNKGGAIGFGLMPALTRMMYRMVGNDGCFSFLPLSHTLVVVLFCIDMCCAPCLMELLEAFILDCCVVLPPSHTIDFFFFFFFKDWATI